MNLKSEGVFAIRRQMNKGKQTVLPNSEGKALFGVGNAALCAIKTYHVKDGIVDYLADSLEFKLLDLANNVLDNTIATISSNTDITENAKTISFNLLASTGEGQEIYKSIKLYLGCYEQAELKVTLKKPIDDPNVKE